MEPIVNPALMQRKNCSGPRTIGTRKERQTIQTPPMEENTLQTIRIFMAAVFLNCFFFLKLTPRCPHCEQLKRNLIRSILLVLTLSFIIYLFIEFDSLIMKLKAKEPEGIEYLIYYFKSMFN